MLRRRFLLNGEDSTPDYIITYYADKHINFFVDNNLNKKLYFVSQPYEAASETVTPFKLVLDTFDNGVGQWGFKSVNSQPLTTYGPAIIDGDSAETATKIGIFNQYKMLSGYTTYAGDINSVVFPKGLTSCGLTYLMCSSTVSEISLPSSLQTIPSFAFMSTAITNITIPPNVTRIGSSAFQDNTLLTDVTLLGVNAPNIDRTCSRDFAVFDDRYIQNIYVPYPESYLTTSEWYYYKGKIKQIPGIFKWNGECSFTHISGDEYGGTAGKYMIPTTPVTELTSGSIRRLNCDVLEFPETLTKVISDFCGETSMHKLTKVVWNAPTCEIDKYFTRYNVFDHIQDLTLTDTVQVCPSFFWKSPNLNHLYIGKNVQTISYFPKSNYITWTSDNFQTSSAQNVNKAVVFIDEACQQFPLLTNGTFISPVHMLATNRLSYVYCRDINDFYSNNTNNLIGLLLISPTINSKNWIDECNNSGFFGPDLSKLPRYQIDVPSTFDTMIQIPINSESVNIPSNIVYSPENLVYFNSNYTINGGFIKFGSCAAENSESIVNLVDIGKWCSSYELDVNTIVSKCKDLLINGVATDKIIIPEGVIKITELPFGSRNISEITIPSTVKVCGRILDTSSHIDKITWNVKTLNSFSRGQEIFSYCNCPNVVIGDSVEQIPYYFMDGNKELQQITIPSNVKEIADYAFDYCENLTNVSFSEGLEAIGKSAFQRTNITSLTLPSTIKYLGSYCFKDTPWYSNLPEGPIYINNIFYDYKGTAPEVLIIEPGTIAIAGGACIDDTNIKQVILPDTLLTIGDSAFQNSNVSQINIPDSVEFIGNDAFAGCPFFTYSATEPYMYVDNHLFIWGDIGGLEIRSGTKTMNVSNKRNSSSFKTIMNIQTNEELISIVNDQGYIINMHVSKNVKHLPTIIQGTLTVHSENPYYTDCGVGVIMSKDTCELYANGKCTVIPDCVKSIRKLGVWAESYIEIPKSVQFIETTGIAATQPFTLKYLGTKNDFYLNVVDNTSFGINPSNITFIFNDV